MFRGRNTNKQGGFQLVLVDVYGHLSCSKCLKSGFGCINADSAGIVRFFCVSNYSI